MSLNAFAGDLIRNLETTISPEVSGILEPAAPPDTNPLSQPLDLNAFAPAPTAARPRPAEVRSWDRAAQQREASLNSPGLRKLGSLAKMFPGAEKVRVRRLMQDGDWGPIGEWPMRAIASSGDAESFIMTYVRPKWGGGRYQISVFDAANRETNAGEVVLPEPIGGELTGTTPAATDTVMLKMLDQLREKNSMQQPVTQPDPIDLMHRTNKLLTDLKGKDSNTELMVAMMQMQAAQAQQSQQMMMQLLTQRQDPELASLKAELAALKAAPMPMPMPAPGPEVSPLMEKMLMMIAPVLIERVLKPEFSTKDLLDLARPQTPQKSDLDAMKEAVNFLQSVQGSQKQVSLIDELEKLKMLKEVAASVSGGDNAAPAGATFFDALGALFSNKMFGDSLGKMMGADIDQRRAAAAAPRQLPAQAPVHQAPQAPATQRPVTAPAAAQQRAASAPVQFPGNMRDLCASMEAADSHEKRIQYTTETLYTLRGIPVWTAFVDSLLEHAVHDRSEPALNGLRGWLKMLIDKGLLDERAAVRIVESFTEHWISFHTVVRQLMNLEPLPEPVVLAPAAEVPATEAAPTPETLPAPADDAEEGGDDEEAGDDDE